MDKKENSDNPCPLINEELGIKSVENMTKENKTRLIKFLWNLASAILAAVGTALGVSCAVMA